MEPTPSFPTTPAPAPTDAGVKQSKLVWIIAAVVALAIAAVAWYFYYASRVPALPSGEDAATRALEAQGASDEIGAIEEDLGATELDGLDAELQDIEAELVQ